MRIHELHTVPIERIRFNSGDEVGPAVQSNPNRPLIISGLQKEVAFLKDWNLDFFERMNTKVPVQKPEADGVNYFLKYFKLSMGEFISRIRNGESLYIGAREILKDGGVRSDKDGLGLVADDIPIPPWIRRERIYSSNLWIGAGNNRTLLHYDAWDGFLLLAQGTKEFFMFPRSETGKMYQYGSLEYRSLLNGAVLHSKIKPLDVQPEFQETFSKASGFRGVLHPGEIIYIPAGYWHYVESEGLNIGVNFFVHFDNRRLHFEEPLRTYWIKDNITMRPIRWFYRSREFAGRQYRKLFSAGPSSTHGA
jgi:Cupin-like domain